MPSLFPPQTGADMHHCEFPTRSHDMKRGCLTSTKWNGGSPQLKEILEKIHQLETFESEVAERLGISAEDIDPVMILDEVKTNVDCDMKYPRTLKKLRALRNLRHQYSRARETLSVDVDVRSSLPGAPHRVDASRFWAVLIGINNYASYSLDGCVEDAELMQNYLTEDLGIPRNRIQRLLGSKEHTSPDDPLSPSRSHIIGTLLSLITNPEIAFGDNIIIYYSGHGSQYRQDTEQRDEIEYIQALCPIDRDTLDTNGQPVPDISDREFNSTLSLICRAKGHHITVILDCCYSGGVSRSLPEPGTRTSPCMERTTLHDMLVVGENNLMHYEEHHSILADDWQPDMDSHVILAACHDYQPAMAKEVKRADGSVAGYIGIFTDSLVRVLRSGYWKKDTKYIDLLDYLDKPFHQIPVVAGKHKHDYLWFQD